MLENNFDTILEDKLPNLLIQLNQLPIVINILFILIFFL